MFLAFGPWIRERIRNWKELCVLFKNTLIIISYLATFLAQSMILLKRCYPMLMFLFGMLEKPWLLLYLQGRVGGQTYWNPLNAKVLWWGEGRSKVSGGAAGLFYGGYFRTRIFALTILSKYLLFIQTRYLDMTILFK